MTLHHTGRRNLLLIVVTVAFVLMLGAAKAPTASAHGAAVQPSTHGELTVVFHGKTYRVALNQTIKLPTTWPDGSTGFIVVGSGQGESVMATKAGLIPYNPVPGCETVYSSVEGTNIYGGVLWKYTIFQNWCYDGYGDITSHGAPYAQWASYLGWSMAAHSETTTYFDGTSGIAGGLYRFNGPLGFGCSSGETGIDYYGNGTYDTYWYQGGVYGC